MKICSAFKGLGADIRLYTQKSETFPFDGDMNNIFAEFGVRHPYPVIPAEESQVGLEHVNWQMVHQAILDGCTHIYTRSLDAAMFAVMADIPTYLELHKAVSDDRIYKLEFILRSPSFEKLVVISQPLVNQFSPILRNVAEKTVVLHDGANPVPISPPKFTLDKSPSARLHLGYVGHLYPGKGAELSFELAKRLPNADFHMLGGTPEDLANWRDISAQVPNIKFYGHRSHHAVKSFIHSVDVAIATFLRKVQVHGAKHNIGDFFSPLKIFEYMALGKPILNSDLPVLREVLEDSCSIPDDHISPRRSALFMARLVLRDIRDGAGAC